MLFRSVYGLVQEIEEYLCAPYSKDDLLGYLHPNGVFDGPMPMLLVFPIALYAHPPIKTAPMPIEKRAKSYIELEGALGNEAHLMSFLSGICEAERFHGIGGRE